MNNKDIWEGELAFYDKASSLSFKYYRKTRARMNVALPYFF